VELSHSERRRLAEIESHLRTTDPRFAARMQAVPKPSLLDTGLLWWGLVFALALLAAAGRPGLAAALAVGVAAVHAAWVFRRVRDRAGRRR